MKIRFADKFDLPKVIEMLKHYRDACPLPELKLADDESYINSLFNGIIHGQGVCLIADNLGEAVGMIMAIRAPSLWDPKLVLMKEMCYWVEPEHRNTSAGYKLLKHYRDFCSQEKEQNKIAVYTISKMVNSPELKYDRFGFELLEETWRQ
jgi:GNAT superfamily N-acetyltransferase